MLQTSRFTRCLHRVGIALAAVGGPVTFAQTLAFPGAEGFGRLASGGRGGDVYIVTNLNNSGPGSLREAVGNRASGVPRTVVFAVSGTIYLESTLRITEGNLTIAGQTAPGDGICLAHYPIDPSDSSNVIIRFIRSRLGDSSGKENDAFSCRYASNMIIDHCSFSWSVDETASSYDNTDFTMQWCIISESLRDSVHSKGDHGYGAIWGGLGATFHHNLIAHHDSRNPRFNGARTHGTANELVEMRNNVIYNWRGNSTYGGEPTDAGLPARQNMINNTYKSGPATGTGSIRHRIIEPTKNTASTGATLSLFHITGNHTTASATVTADNWNGGVQVVSSAEFPVMRADAAFVAPPVITQTAQDAFPLVIAHAGCRLPARDTVDARIVTEVQNGTFTHRGSKGNLAGIIDSQADVGGWPALVSTPAPPDGDSDGMPDAWETARGLNPADPADRNAAGAGGYTNLELYLNELAASAFPIPQLESQPQSQTVTAGTGFSLSVAATGTAPLSYQWHHENDVIDGATAATYTVAASTTADTGAYHVVVTNGYGSVRSETATVAFDALPPVIDSEPQSSAVEAGQAVAFTVSATGTQPITCQWFRGARPIPGATGTTLELGPATLESAGPYHAVVTNAHGSDTSATATLTVTSTVQTGVFSTGFATDTIHSGSPVVSPTSTNWHVMSSKDARTSIIADSQLDLTMAVTSSGIVETAARFSVTPVSPGGIGEKLRLRITLATTNVRTLGLGLYQSGGVSPHTGLINAQLVGSSSSLAMGGTQGWSGFRFHLDSNAPAATIEGRPAQPGTTNASQSVIVPGTSSSAPTVQAITSTAAPGFAWEDSNTYTLTLDLERASGDALRIGSTIHAGTNTAAPAVAAATATTAGTSLAGGFDALAIGYRNRDSSSVSHVRVSQVTVQQIKSLVSAADPFEAFIVLNGLDPATTGSPTADPDSDGIANAMEFILGGDPRVASTSILPVLVAASGWRFRFLRHIDTSSAFHLAVEESAELHAWDPLAHGVDGIAITAAPFNASHEQIEVFLPDSPASRRFLRLTAKPAGSP